MVVPSLADEVRSLSVLEAFARSQPVVATRVGAHPEVVREGEDGTLVEPADAAGSQRPCAPSTPTRRAPPSSGRQDGATADVETSSPACSSGRRPR